MLKWLLLLLLGTVLAAPAAAQTPQSLTRVITQAPGASALSGSELLPLIQNNSVHNITYENFLAGVTQTYGLVGDGTTDNYEAFSQIFARTDSPRVFMPTGTYRISCNRTFVAQSGVILIGAGRGNTVIKLDQGCVLNNDPGSALFHWQVHPFGMVRDLTVDMNGATAAVNQNIFLFQGSTFAFLNSEVKGAHAAHMHIISASTTTGTSISDMRIQDNILSFVDNSIEPNQCIATTTLGNTGTITRSIVTGNICVNTGMQIDGTHNLIANNDISGYQFGAGIFAPPTDQDSYNVIANNNLHDSGLLHDVNNVAMQGIESNGNKSLIIGNLCTNLGTACVTNFGHHVLISGNSAVDVGKVASPNHGLCEDAAFVTPALGGKTWGAYSTWVGNKARNTGGSTSIKYGYCESGSVGFAPGVRLSNNDFESVSVSWYSYSQGLNPPLVDWTLLAQKTETINVSSIEFTGIDTGSFRYFKMECNAFGPASAGQMQLRVGQGVAPTWQTGASYAYTGIQSSQLGSDLAQFNSSTGTGILLGTGNWGQSHMNMLTVEFGNLGAVDTKAFRFSATGLRAGTGLQDVRGSGAWGADNNPITGVQFSAVSGNLTAYGGCMLWGRP